MSITHKISPTRVRRVLRNVMYFRERGFYARSMVDQWNQWGLDGFGRWVMWLILMYCISRTDPQTICRRSITGWIDWWITSACWQIVPSPSVIGHRVVHLRLVVYAWGSVRHKIRHSARDEREKRSFKFQLQLSIFSWRLIALWITSNARCHDFHMDYRWKCVNPALTYAYHADVDLYSWTN